ncbi:MAG: PolC-type DNA polymerase III [Clostridia bacterium]|nr:PolC-type DNA polymerase III [Clostridia bacterium]
MSKTLIELFNRFDAGDTKYERLLKECPVKNVKINKELKFVEVDIEPSEVVDKKTIYGLEEALRKCYALQSVRIKTVYKPEWFGRDYIPEVLLEAGRRGAISRGFFNEYNLEMTENKIKLEISFTNGGIELLYSAKTPNVISEVIFEEFGLRYDVEIVRDENGGIDFEAFVKEQEKGFAEKINRAEKQREEQQRVIDIKAEKDEEKKNLERVTALGEKENVFEKLEGGIIHVGDTDFDTTEAEYIYGEKFDLEPVPMRSLDKPLRHAVIFGEVFQAEAKENRNGDKVIFEFAVTDNDSSIFCKMVLESDESQITREIKSGDVLAIKGNVRFDKFANELVMNVLDIARIKKITRQDKSEEKRVELHLHTCMSSMDAIIAPEDAIKLAQKWGHRAIAITDHGNVQAFPRAMYASEKTGMKVIYGMEAYFVDDTARVVYGDKTANFTDDEFCIFDIETTGLSAQTCKITEIGAVIFKNGEVTDVFSTYVDPECPIPQNIIEITGITDDMVKGAPKTEEAVKNFLEFVGDRILIAHNASFDIGFIKKACEDHKIHFKPTYIDTVALSRFLNPDLKKHKLNILAEYYNLGEFGHHRAYNDAEMLSKIFGVMCQKLKKEGARDTEEMARIMGEKADPLKLRPYHMVLLAKNKIGLKNLYKLVSKGYLDYFYRNPRVPKTVLNEHRDGLIIGSACEAGELFSAIIAGKPMNELIKIAKYYDYLEIQPLSNNRFMIAKGLAKDEEDLKNFNRKVIEVARAAKLPVCATCDAHFIEKRDEIHRKMLQFDRGFADEGDSELYFRTTDEMLEEFSYLGEDTAREVVITNPNLINDMVEQIRPIPTGFYPPSLPGCEEELQEMCWKRAKEWYGDPLPELVKNRLERELNPIIGNGFAIMYIIAQKLIANSEAAGYLVGSRGSVGSSFAATMCGVTEVNPLPPHYRCPKCKYSYFFNDGSVGSGFDLPDKDCPECGTNMIHDGHDIPFETFLGFKGEKTPDIDLNFSGVVQADAHKYTEVLFGEENVFRAGTLGTLADKKAFMLVNKYLENKGVSVNRAELQRLINKCLGIKLTTGQHPGGVIVIPHEYDIYDFSPVQHPAEDKTSSTITTHFEFSHLHDTILKLDILGHDVPTKYKMLENYSGISILDVPMNDKKVMSLFTSPNALGVTEEDIGSQTGTFGLPEFGTGFTRQMLIDTQPKYFSDLLQISGLSHGTGVWLGNAKDLIKEGTCTISECIGTRDNIMVYLQYKGLENGDAFNIMENVRKKNKTLTPEMEAKMREHNVPEWYIDSCKKIEYMFPKAHAAAYVMSAIRLGWYKVYHPVAFYAAYFTAAPDGFDGETVMGGRSKVLQLMDLIKEKGKEASATEKEQFTAMQLVNEAMARGVKFLPVNLYKSDAKAFLPEDGKIRIPFACLAGLGESVALNIVKARDENPLSIEELAEKAKLSKKIIELLRVNGALGDLPEQNQISFF